MKRAYLVHVPEFVLIVDDEGDFFQRPVRDAAEAYAAEHVRTQILTREELRRRGDEVPEGTWNPNQQFTCEQIAREMPLEELRDMARRVGQWVASRLGEIPA